MTDRTSEFSSGDQVPTGIPFEFKGTGSISAEELRDLIGVVRGQDGKIQSVPIIKGAEQVVTTCYEPIEPITPVEGSTDGPNVVTHNNNDNRRERTAIWPWLILPVIGAVVWKSCFDQDKQPMPDIGEQLRVGKSAVECHVIVDNTDGDLVHFRQDKSDDPVAAYDIGALKSVGDGPDQRLWSDAITTPLERPELQGFYAEICKNPHMGAVWGNMFANMEVDGVKMTEINPWLQRFAGNPGKVNDIAMEFIPHYGQSREWIEANIDVVEEAMREYEELAEMLVTLVGRFGTDETVQQLSAIESYHLLAGGTTVGQLPEVGITENMYIGNNMTFELTFKDGRCVRVFLLNVDDGRPGLPADQTCYEVITTTTLPDGTTTTTVAEIKLPRPLPAPGPAGNPGSGGSPEQGMDPENDSDEDGYGPGDEKPVSPEQESDEPVHNPTEGTPPNTGAITPKPRRRGQDVKRTNDNTRQMLQRHPVRR